MQYQLFIAGKEADLDDSISIALSYTSIDTDTPSAEHGSYSKSVELKGTENNNSIFGQLYDPTRRIIDGNSNSGIYFNPRKRTDYVLWYNGDIIEKGYLKVDSVSTTDGDITYSITLYSDLGDFFYSLMYNSETGDEITLGDLHYGFTDPSGQTLNEDEGTLLYWDKDYVSQTWDALSAGTDDMRVQNHIVAAPAYGGYYDDFGNNKVLVNYGSLGDGSAKQLLQPVFNSEPATRSGYTDYRGWILTEATRDLDEWEVRDLRSVYQRPAIKMSTILDAISKPENNGGYEVVWDDEIKNSPYYQKSYLMLNRLNFELDENANAVKTLGTTLKIVDCGNGIFKYGTMYDATDSAITVFNLSGLTNPHATISMDNVLTGVSIFAAVDEPRKLCTSYRSQYHSGKNLNHYWAWVYGGMAVRISAYDGGTLKAQTPVYLYTTPTYNSDKEFGYGVDNWRQRMATQLECEPEEIVVRENTFVWSDEERAHKWASPILADLDLPAEDNLTLYLQIGWCWVTDRSNAKTGIAFQTENADKGYMTYPYYTSKVVLLNDEQYSTGIYDGTINPNVQMTNVNKAILFGGTESPYSYLVGFTRMMGAKYQYDLSAKKIYIRTRNNYYLPEGHVIDRWIDRSQEYEITPTLSEYKWYEYGFETPETYASQLYDRKNKIGYGKKKVDTGYYFNNDSNNLFEGIPYTNGIPYLQQSIYYSVVSDVPSVLVSPTLDVSIYKESGQTVDDETIKIKGYSSFHAVPILKDASGNKICCFDSDNGSVDELTNCLVFFDGMRQMVDEYQISDNIPIMATLNENPCFMFVSGQTPVYVEKDALSQAEACKKVSAIPVFSKYLTNADGVYTDSLDFSKPAYTFIGNSGVYGDDIAIYDRYWKDFISDLYERNGKAVVCRMFLREKPEVAMRKFYFFDSAVWVMSEITDFEASSDGTTQVRFVKVYDTGNYTDGNIVWDEYYSVDDSVDAPKYAPALPSGETGGTVTVIHNDNTRTVYTFDDGIVPADYFSGATEARGIDVSEGITEIGDRALKMIYTDTYGLGVNLPSTLRYVGEEALPLVGYDSVMGIRIYADTAPEIARQTVIDDTAQCTFYFPWGSDYSNWFNTLSEPRYQINPYGGGWVYYATGAPRLSSGATVEVLTDSGTTLTYNYATGKIPSSAFDYRTDIVSVTIGEGITEIGSNAFAGCSNLNTIRIGDRPTGSGNLFNGVSANGVIYCYADYDSDDFKGFLFTLPRGWRAVGTTA